MISTDLILKELTEKIHSVYISTEYNQLKAKHSQPNFLAAINKTRSETTFSALLGWVINNKEFALAPSSSIKYLLLLLAKNAIIQSLNGSYLMDDTLSESIITNNFSVRLKHPAKTEYPAKGKDRVDLFIECDVQLKNNQTKSVRIYIENKIDSKEGLNQCKRYYDYFNSKKWCRL